MVNRAIRFPYRRWAELEPSASLGACGALDEHHHGDRIIVDVVPVCVSRLVQNVQNMTFNWIVGDDDLFLQQDAKSVHQLCTLVEIRNTWRLLGYELSPESGHVSGRATHALHYEVSPLGQRSKRLYLGPQLVEASGRQEPGQWNVPTVIEALSGLAGLLSGKDG